MRKNLKHYVSLILVLVLSFTVGCGKNNSYSISEYNYTKESDNLVFYSSSDNNLDFFLNDYFKRHAGGIYENGLDQMVTSVAPGISSNQFFWQEWMSLALYPLSNLQNGSDSRIKGMRKLLSNVPVDRYGYCWQESDLVRSAYSELASGEHRMGWPFPTTLHADGMNRSWDFNGNDSTFWTSNFGATLVDGLFKGTTNSNMDTIEFVSPMPRNMVEEITAYYCPLLEIDLRMYTKETDCIEDIYIYYTTSASPNWSEDKKVSVNETAFIAYDYDIIYEHMLFIPMYAEENWNCDMELNSSIKQIKVKVVPKEGKKLNGEFGLSYVRSTFDTRQSNNCSLLISSLLKDYEYTRDLDYLTENVTRARKCMNFYMQMYDEERHLNKQSYLVGHDADKTSPYKSDHIAMTIGNGYWDMSFMPIYDFQSNVYFYKAIIDLIKIEKILEENGITIDKSEAKVLTCDRNFNRGESEYKYTNNDLERVANDVVTELRKSINESDKTGFWNEKTGRFVAGYSFAEDKWYDYGYTMWNTEAIYYGVATDSQAKEIMDWISGKRIVEEDSNGSTGDDIYFFELAPRVNTYCSEDKCDVGIFTGMYSGMLGVEYGVTQVQNGGAIMYTSFYDLMSRIKVYGADDAFKRLKRIEKWYKKIYDYYVTTDNYNAHPDRFYWDYYENSQWDSDGDGVGEYWGIQNSLKGDRERNMMVGIIGIDGEFLESLLMIAAIHFGFFGLSTDYDNTLVIEPKLPSHLDYWKMENLVFGGKYDLTIFDNGIQINSVRGKCEEMQLKVILDAPKRNEKVYVDGVIFNRYTIKDGKVYIALPLRSVRVEVK